MKSIFICLFLILSVAAAEASSLSNTSVIDSLIRPFMRHSLQNIDFLDQQVLIHMDSSDTPLQRYITFRVEEAFRNRGANVIFGIDASKTNYRVDLYIPKAKILYTRRYARHLLGKTWICRSAIVELDLKILKIPENKMLFSESYESSMNDEFPFRFLNDVENGIGWNPPKIPPIRGVRSWLEPFLLISSIGAVVYLFFAIRS